MLLCSPRRLPAPAAGAIADARAHEVELRGKMDELGQMKAALDEVKAKVTMSDAATEAGGRRPEGYAC
eukprot:926370-Prymnesium_polylepis.1